MGNTQRVRQKLRVTCQDIGRITLIAFRDSWVLLFPPQSQSTKSLWKKSLEEEPDNHRASPFTAMSHLRYLPLYFVTIILGHLGCGESVCPHVA